MKQCLLLPILSVLLLSFSQSFATPELTINGAKCITVGSPYHYSFTGDYQEGSVIYWSINGGTIAGTNDTYQSGTEVTSIDVIWSEGGNLSVMVDGKNGQKGVFIRSQLTGGIITSPQNQDVYYNTLPATITCSPPGGGDCTSPVYIYQWQQSDDNNNAHFTDITGAIGTSLSFTVCPDHTTYYRRKVTETVSDNEIYSDVATINLVSSALNPGQIFERIAFPTYFLQVVYNDPLPPVTTTPATGGTTFQKSYIWEAKYNSELWSYIGVGEAFPISATVNVTDDIQIRRKAVCGNDVAYSNILTYSPLYTTVDFENLNYVRENVIAIRGVKSWFEADQLNVGSKFQTTSYLDGLGRTIQTVSKQTANLNNGAWADNVSVNAYDEYGRQDKTYLPYASSVNIGKYKPDALTEQVSAVHAKYADIGNTYAQTIFDNDALSRVTKTLRPGNAWGNINIGTTYDYDYINFAGDLVKKWEIGYAETDLPYTAGLYDNAKLYRRVTTDEKGKQVVEYKDFSGNLIFTKVQDKEESDADFQLYGYKGWVCTYYVYDDFGRLRFTISPKAVEELLANSDAISDWAVTANLAAELCFSNYYDNFGRVIIKHSAGAGSQDIVYDQKNRLVYSSDAVDKTKKRWLVNLSDVYDRPVVSGVMSKTSLSAPNYTRAQLQIFADGVSLTPVTVQATTTGNTGSLPKIIVGVRDTWRNEYVSGDEIVFGPGFSSSVNKMTGQPNDYFIAKIDNTPPAPVTEQIAADGNFVPANATLVTLSVNYYDNYNYTGAKLFSTNYSFAASTNPDILATKTAARTFGSLTGQKVRVVDDEDYTNDRFLLTTIYYDEYDHLLQKVSENYLQATTTAPVPKNDVLTNQYDYAGKLLSSCFKETVPGTLIQDYPVVTKYEYDVLGRMISLSKNYGNLNYKKLVDYTYDELGQMVAKKLSPDYDNGNGLETLTYKYNIQGWLAGINESYSLTSYNGGQWQHYFGESLGYISEAGRFTNSQYNGNITGAIWKSQGDNKPRKYDYDYTNTGYLKSALFIQKEKPSADWLSGKYDFSMPQILYDANGNLTKLQQKGLIPGQSNAATIDDLTYDYDNTNGPSNRLIKVTDGATGTQNGTLGDFANGVNTPLVQYTYNDDGNLIKDYNKNIQDAANTNSSDGILYNVLNKPYKVTVTGKYVMQYVYDAAGTKLARKVTNLSVTPQTTKWQYYINDMVLEDYDVQFFINETGRLRIGKDITGGYSPAPYLTIGGNNSLTVNDKPAFFDFYITDHLDNTRMILTEEEHSEYHKATMEVSDSRQKNYEETMFGQVNTNGQPLAGNELIATRDDITALAQDWASNYNSTSNIKASKLNKDKPVGPNAFFKVMAGDKLTLHTDYFFYNQDATSNGSAINSVINSIISALSASSAAAGGVKGVSGQIQSQLANAGDFTGFIQNPTGTPGTKPYAHLNWLFFDENFSPIPNDIVTGLGSNAAPVIEYGDGKSITQTDIKVPANGYAFIYVSNISNVPVWFDNLTIQHQRGRILQENHYYPYGLQIAAISSKAAGKLDNMYRYQGAYSEFEEETGWNDFELRTYDAQIGRWTGVDPYDEFASGYVGMGNDPANSVDPDGGDADPCCLDVTVKAIVNRTAVAAKSAAYEALVSVVMRDAFIYSYSLINKNGIKETFASPTFLGNSTTSGGQEFTYDGGEYGYHIENISKNVSNLSYIEPENALEYIRETNAKIWDFHKVGDRNGNIKIYANGRGDRREVAEPTAVEVVDGPETWLAGGLYGGIELSAERLAAKEGVEATQSVFIVTKEGVALPKGGIIPRQWIESPFPSPRSSIYGEMKDGTFIQKLRIDPPRFAEPSHFHLNNQGKKLNIWRWFN